MTEEKTVKSVLTILQKDRFIMWAKLAAENEYDRYFEKIHPYIQRVEISILRELYAHEGCVGYLIRVYVEAPVSVVKQFHEAAGVNIELK